MPRWRCDRRRAPRFSLSPAQAISSACTRCRRTSPHPSWRSRRSGSASWARAYLYRTNPEVNDATLDSGASSISVQVQVDAESSAVEVTAVVSRSAAPLDPSRVTGNLEVTPRLKVADHQEVISRHSHHSLARGWSLRKMKRPES